MYNALDIISEQAKKITMCKTGVELILLVGELDGHLVGVNRWISGICYFSLWSDATLRPQNILVPGVKHHFNNWMFVMLGYFHKLKSQSHDPQICLS